MLLAYLTSTSSSASHQLNTEISTELRSGSLYYLNSAVEVLSAITLLKAAAAALVAGLAGRISPGRSTYSMKAMGALSPARNPHLRIRV